MGKDRTKAVFYWRVVCKEQVRDPDYVSPEVQCQNYADSKSYDVVNIFSDEGQSGNNTDRPGLNKLLEFLNENSEQQLIVIVLTRKHLATDLLKNMQICNAISEAGGMLESVVGDIDSSPEGHFLSTILGAVDELVASTEDRDQQHE